MGIRDNLIFFSNPLEIGLWVWFFYAGAVVIFAFVSVILVYHWTAYRATAAMPKFLLLIYFGGSVIPLLLMLSVAISYLPKL